MSYYIDLENISIDDYKEILKSADLLPSRMILKDNIDGVFAVIQKQKIENVDELYNALKTKNKLQEFSKQSGIQENYLKILIREVNSYRPRPNKLSDFPGTSENVFLALESLGIKNTCQLFEHILTPQKRSELSEQTGVDKAEIERLARLTDLSRIRWVNHTFAYVLLEAGYDSARNVANANYKNLYEEVKKLNEERQIYKGHIGLHDMKLCIEAARDVPLDIAF